jgi:hypothetical protein
MQVLDRGAQAVANARLRYTLDRGAQAYARSAATLPRQEKYNSADVQRNRANITGFISTVAI